MALPHWKLALAFAGAARKHGNKVMHINNVALLTQDLGKALKQQRSILEDPDAGTLETMYDLVGIMAEVKVLMIAVTKKLDISTSGKSTVAVLQDIVTEMEGRQNPLAVKDIKETLDWAAQFFAREDVKALLAEDKIEIEAPKSIKGLGKTFKQIGQKTSQETKRLHGFLKIAKGKGKDKKEPPKGDPKP